MIKQQVPLPNSNVPPLQPNGQWTREWYLYFQSLDRVTRETVKKLNVEFP